MSRLAVELPFTELPSAADRAAAGSLTRQVASQLRSAIAAGRLRAGERLPASRVLATSLGVSRTVVTGAYAQLDAEGWLEGRHGSGTFVTAVTPGHSPSPADAWPAGLARTDPFQVNEPPAGEPAGGPAL
ncbi:MAG: winged helix-turn-helix domain-containing protein, partial [Actinomycetota bacterium]